MKTPSLFFLSPFILLFLFSNAHAQQNLPAHNPAFIVLPLGVRGGLDESNLSSYMVAAANTAGTADSNAYICLDAGTLYAGIRKAVDEGVFKTTVSDVQKHYIKGYFISHPHLDHVAGLIINSPEDTAKSIYGMSYTIDVLKEKYFTWEAWANFGNEGEKPALGKYHYTTLTEGEEVPVPGTRLFVKAFPLSHGNPYKSTAFLVRQTTRNEDNYLLYLGDTGADTVEHADKLHRLWQAVAPLLLNHQLKGIFIEVSFPNEQPRKLLFGHLTPELLLEELKNLETAAGKGSIRGLPVVIIHRKPSGNQENLIRQELEANPSATGIRLVFPSQAKPLAF